GEQSLLAAGDSLAGHAETARQPRLGDDAERDGLAVRPPLVAGGGLQRVADGVAVVERVAELALLLGIALDDAGLEAAGAADDPVDDLELTGEQPRGVALDLLEVGAVEDGAVLDDLGQPRAELALRQRAHDRRVDDHQARLVEGT